MVIKSLQVTDMSAKDLPKVNRMLRMHPYVTVSLSGDHKRSTDVDNNGDTSPSWVKLLTFPIDEARTDLLTLVFEIMTDKFYGGEKAVGSVKVPIAELLEKQGDGNAKKMSCSVSLPSGVGETQGVLEFTYKFSEELPGGCGNTPAPKPKPPNKSGQQGLFGKVIEAVTVAVVGASTSAFFGQGWSEDAADPSEDAADPSEDAADGSEAAEK